jgi:hypothetical protein
MDKLFKSRKEGKKEGKENNLLAHMLEPKSEEK